MTLQVLHKRVPCGQQEQSLFLTAVENTWIHGRQKRREGLRHLRELPRASHCPGTSSQTTVPKAAPQNPSPSTQISSTQNDSAENKATSVQEVAVQEVAVQQQPAGQMGNSTPSHETSEVVIQHPAGKQKEVLEKVSGEDVDMDSSTCTDAGQESDPKEAPTAVNDPPSKRPLSPGAVKPFLFKCLLNVILEEGDVVIEMHWVEGQNKDLMNQLCTYLRNTLLKSVGKS